MSDEFLVRTVKLHSTSNVAVCVSDNDGETWKYFLRNSYKSMSHAKADAQAYMNQITNTRNNPMIFK